MYEETKKQLFPAVPAVQVDLREGQEKKNCLTFDKFYSSTQKKN